MMSAKPAWVNVQGLEDAMAVLSSLDERAHVIRTQAWRLGSFQQIFLEANAQAREIAKLREFMSNGWTEMLEKARQ